MAPRKNTPEYEAWKNSPEYAAWVQKATRTRNTPEARANFSTKQREVWASMTPEEREKRNKACGVKNIGNQYTKGLKRTPEQITKHAEYMKQRWGQLPEEEKERTRAQLKKTSGYWEGKKRPEIGAIISAKNKGKTPPNKGTSATPKQKLTNSEAQKLRWANATEEQRIKMLTPWINASKHKKNTTIEQYIAAKLDLQGIVYEREKRIGNYYVDFYILAEHKVIEVNGCWWHSCPQCGFNGEGSIEKREKDAKRYERLRAKGYIVEVLWEHDIRQEMNKL